MCVRKRMRMQLTTKCKRCQRKSDKYETNKPVQISCREIDLNSRAVCKLKLDRTDRGGEGWIYSV